MTSIDDLLIILDEVGDTEDVTVRRSILERVLDLRGAPELQLTSPQDYADRTGYDPAFITEFPVALPKVEASLQPDLVQVEGGSYAIPYEHFSLMMSRSRRFARATAANIDGGRRLEIERGRDRWVFDPRIGTEFQVGNDLYADNPLDRGHLVRRQDPAWGDSLEESRRANDDTFHFTNCSPQHEDFNQNTTTWHGLEDYILNITRKSGLLVSVFTGPVLADDDPEYRDLQIPREFWKVVVTLGSDGSPSATAYLLNQSGLLSTLDELAGPFGRFGVFQTRVASVEAATGLDFGPLRDVDPLAQVEEVASVPRQIEELHEITI